MDTRENEIHDEPKAKSLERRKVLMLAGACAVILAVVFFAFGGGGPRDAEIKRAIEEELAETWPHAGSYDAEGAWGVTSMDILSKEKQSAEGLLNDAFGDSYYGVMASVKASNGAVEMESVLEVNFVHYEGSWQPFSAPSAKEKAYRAIQGPDESKIASNAMEVLRQADSESGGGQLRSLYADCTPKVSDAKFDESAQKATAKLVFEREDAFSSAKGTVSAAFAFENGTWCLTGVKASRDASDVSYDKLVGTWKGTFQSTVSHHRYGNCFGAQDKELTIKIDSVDATSGKVEGSFQGLVHYHAYLDADANECEGDSDSGELPFVATLAKSAVIGRNYSTMQTMLVGADYTAPGTVDGEIRIAFGFGTSDDPNAAVAKLYTKANREKGWNSQCNFEDTYTLVKAE